MSSHKWHTKAWHNKKNKEAIRRESRTMGLNAITEDKLRALEAARIESLPIWQKAHDALRKLRLE